MTEKTHDVRIEHKKVSRGTFDIHYFAAGEPGRELLLLLHPAFGDHRCFEFQMAAFSRSYRVVAVDLLGHGLSQPVRSSERLDASAEHLLAILQAEGQDQCHVVGVSMGSLIAQYLAYLHPDRVRTVTAVGGYPIHRQMKDVAKAQRKAMLQWLLWIFLSMDRFRRHLGLVSVIRPEEQRKFTEMARGFARRSFRVMSGLGNVIKERPGVAVGRPLLILCGDHDLDIARQAAVRWHAMEPGSEYVQIAQAGHCVNMDNPDVFNGVLLDFLRRHAAAPAAPHTPNVI